MRLDQTHDLTSQSHSTFSSSNHKLESHQPTTSDQLVPPHHKIPHPPPQSTRPSAPAARKIRLPPAKQIALAQHQQTSLDSKPPSSHLIPSKQTTSMISSHSTATTAAYESSNEEDVHNHSSKTIIDLIQPNRVKLQHLNESRIEKDSLNVDESIGLFAKSKNSLEKILNLFNKQLISNKLKIEYTAYGIVLDL